jgi:hypothetical protein
MVDKMDYQKHYNLLIETRRNRILSKETYFEKHHIVPKSMGGSNEKENIIRLTAREHFLAHWLLWRIHKNKEMAFAFYSMVKMGKNQTIKSGRIYEEAKMARREFIIENNKKYHKGKKLTPEHLEKISMISKTMERTKEHKDNISKSLSGKSKSETHKKRLSESLKGYDWSSYTERNKSISIKNSGKNNGRSVGINLSDSEGNFISCFDTMEDARIFINKKSPKELSKSTFFRYVQSGKNILGYIFTKSF